MSMAAGSRFPICRGFDRVMDTLKIRDAQDVEQAVQAAVAAEQPLDIIGHGTKRTIGQRTATNAVLDLSALNGVTSYEPNELIITAGAGAPLADLKSLIDSKNQEFAFEPMDTSALLGTPNGSGTIGGMIAAGLAGPRRIKAGGARDHLLGLTGVSGFGETFKAGGKVVKNVTGYDLCKLIAGSWGTLAVMTEVTLKVMPKAEAEITLVLRGLDEIAATRAMSTALGSPFDVSGVAHVKSETLVRAGGNRRIRCPSRQFAWRCAEELRSSRPHRRCRLDGRMGRDPRRDGVRSIGSTRRPASLAHRLPARLGRRVRTGAGAQRRCRSDLRLGRRADLGGNATVARCRGKRLA